MKHIKRHLALYLLCLTSFAVKAQVENTSTIVDWRQHNLSKYNRMLINPAFSVAREQGRAISFWSRIQWTGVNNAPQTYLLNYSGKIGEHSGGGLGLYQQSLGLLTDSGLLMNYAYRVQFHEKVYITMGLNATLFRRGLNTDAIASAETDPTILENQDDFLGLVMPGINLSVGKFDLGVYAENLFDYNFNQSRAVTDFSNKIYSGHLGVNHPFLNATGMLRNGHWRSIMYVKTQPNGEMQFGGNSMIDLPRIGWLQLGYNNTYGVNGVLGVKLSEHMSIALTYEAGTRRSTLNFGPTYEAMATISLGRGSSSFLVEAEQEDDIKPEEQSEVIAEASDTPNDEEAPEEYQTSEYALIGGEAATHETPTDPTDNMVEITRDADVKGMQLAATQDDLPLLEEEELQTIIDNAGKAGDYEVAAVQGVSDTLSAYEAARGLGLLASLEAAPLEDAAITKEFSVDDPTELAAHQTLEAVDGLKKGFYLVVNVFAQERYFEEFREELIARGFDPKYFINPTNDYWYIYLAYGDSYSEVKQLQRSHLGGRYRADKWVYWVR